QRIALEEWITFSKAKPNKQDMNEYLLCLIMGQSLLRTITSTTCPLRMYSRVKTPYVSLQLNSDRTQRPQPTPTNFLDLYPTFWLDK
ncbi:hypothetical protein, partial [Vibrio sp. OPT46]|uniref:hypothetical protein n=1 Tax=Vibrio sp. OPT46 TaxID=2778645 RepID=UPI001D142FB0